MAQEIQLETHNSDGGNSLWRSLLLKGISLTSPAMATSMPNLTPGLIFIIAWILRYEKVKLSCMYSKVKIAGTLLCVAAIFVLSTNVVLQAATLADLPAPISLCAFTSLIGVFLTKDIEYC
uniref:WAT1-related protein n=1 Tax=Cannabis sativa TaxID=3483 RepID=A0A803PPF7_CANSA